MELKAYWPLFLQDVVEFDQIAGAEQPEFQKAVQDVRNAADDFFLVSLSEYGCSRWEAILGLSVAPGDTLDQRRERIRIRYLDRLPYTYRALLSYLSTVSKDFTVQLDNDAYELFVRITLSGYTQRDALIAVLKQMIPAGLRRGRGDGQPGQARTPTRRRKPEWHDLSQRSPTRGPKC